MSLTSPHVIHGHVVDVVDSGGPVADVMWNGERIGGVMRIEPGARVRAYGPTGRRADAFSTGGEYVTLRQAVLAVFDSRFGGVYVD